MLQHKITFSHFGQAENAEVCTIVLLDLLGKGHFSKAQMAIRKSTWGE